MFVGEKSTFYLRFSNEKILSNLRNKILHSKNWTKIDETSDNKDVDTKKFNNSYGTISKK